MQQINLVNQHIAAPDDWTTTFAVPPAPTPTFTPTPAPACNATIPYLTPDTEHVNIRNSPDSAVQIIGVFYGKQNDAQGNMIEWTPDRNVQIVYMHYDGTWEWYLIEYYGSRGWVRDDLIDNETACPNPPTGPAIEINPSGAVLPTITNGTDKAPNPNDIPVPFGRCTGFPNEFDRARCSYDVYVSLYNHLNLNGDAGDDLLMRDILSIVMMYEVGIHFDDYNPAAPSSKQLYMMEGIARNLSQLCAQARGTTANGELNCDMRGILDWLVGLHGWYDQFGKPLEDILTDPDARSRNIVNYQPLSNAVLSNPTWLLGIDNTRPFTWGNWSSSDPASVNGFNATLALINNPGNGTFIDCAQISGGTCPVTSQSDLWYAELKTLGSCRYTFAVTGRNHPFGQTGTC